LKPIIEIDAMVGSWPNEIPGDCMEIHHGFGEGYDEAIQKRIRR
jgi:hypothetical protein